LAAFGPVTTQSYGKWAVNWEKQLYSHKVYVSTPILFNSTRLNVCKYEVLDGIHHKYVASLLFFPVHISLSGPTGSPSISTPSSCGVKTCVPLVVVLESLGLCGNGASATGIVSRNDEGLGMVETSLCCPSITCFTSSS